MANLHSQLDSHQIHGGYLYKKGVYNRAWKKRYFVLFDDRTISYFEKEKHSKSRNKAKGSIHLTQISRVELVHYIDPNEFQQKSKHNFNEIVTNDTHRINPKNKYLLRQNSSKQNNYILHRQQSDSKDSTNKTKNPLFKYNYKPKKQSKSQHTNQPNTTDSTPSFTTDDINYKNILWNENIPFSAVDVNITTSTLVQWNQTDFLFTIGNAVGNISDLNINYHIADKLSDHCWVYSYVTDICIWNGTTLQIKEWNPQHIEFISYRCDIPLPFIDIYDTYGTTYVNLSSINIRNDVTQQWLKRIKKELFSKETYLCPLTTSASAEILYDPRFMMGFITVGGGNVSVNELLLHSSSASSIIILQGSNAYNSFLRLSNMRREMELYDPYGLNINTYVHHIGNGTLYIVNNSLYGAFNTILNLEYGNNWIVNSTLQFGHIAITDSQHAQLINIQNCHFTQIGKYYTLSALQMSVQKQLSLDVLFPPALKFGAQYIWIEDSHFETHDNTGIIEISSLSNELYSNAMLLRNSFALNIKEFASTVSHGVINILGNVAMQIISNNMTDNVFISNKPRPLFYVNTSNSICFSGNRFTSATIINVEYGHISSCYRPNIKAVFEHQSSCFYSSLAKQTQFEFGDMIPKDYWTATNPLSPLIKNLNNVSITLDHIVFDIAFPISDQPYSIMSMSSGEFLFIDTIISNNIMSFSYDPVGCDIICFDVLHEPGSKDGLSIDGLLFDVHSTEYITQLHMVCTEQDNINLVYINNNQSSFINHAMPYYIEFKYETDFRGVSDLNVSFIITDQYSNPIKDDYSVPILVEFTNPDLFINETCLVNISDTITMHPKLMNSQPDENITIFAVTNHGELISKKNIVLRLPSSLFTMLIKIAYSHILFILVIVVFYCIGYCSSRNIWISNLSNTTHEQANEQAHEHDEIITISTNKTDIQPITDSYQTLIDTLNSANPIFGPCDGQCGSQFASMMNFAITTDIKQMKDYQNLLKRSFAHYGSKMRILLCNLMEEMNCNTLYEKQYDQLTNENFVFDSIFKVECLADLFNELENNGFEAILYQLAYESCKMKRTLTEEIFGDSWKSSINACHGGNTSNQHHNSQHNDEKSDKKSHNGQNNHHTRDKDDAKDDKKSHDGGRDGGGDGDGEDEKDQNELGQYTQTEIAYYLKRLIDTKEHPNYREMIEKGYELSDYELLSAIYYCDSGSSCYNMKQYHRAVEYSCKWRNLYYHLTHAVDKMHKCFHLKNKERAEYRTLFHGSSCKGLDIYSIEQLFMKTVTSFTSDRFVAMDFAQCGGLILAIDNAGLSIHRGTLRAASVDWISIHREKEYIVLPTTFHQFKKLDKDQVDKRGWGNLAQKNVYATRRYKSNKDFLCVHADSIHSKLKPNYNVVATKLDLKRLVCKKLKCLKQNNGILKKKFSFDDMWMNTCKRLSLKMSKMGLDELLQRSTKHWRNEKRRTNLLQSSLKTQTNECHIDIEKYDHDNKNDRKCDEL
eukprot:289739_1